MQLQAFSKIKKSLIYRRFVLFFWQLDSPLATQQLLQHTLLVSMQGQIQHSPVVRRNLYYNPLETYALNIVDTPLWFI